MGGGNHPMIPVPEAIRIVMQRTAEILLQQQQQHGNNNTTTTVSLNNVAWSNLLYMVLEEDVLMEEPGYPPYNASIMDGYAIRTSEFSGSNDDDSPENTDTYWTHRVVNKVYAGDEDSNQSIDDPTTQESLPSAMYITTGAVVPESYNCVVPVEECEVSTEITTTEEGQSATTTTIRIAPSADIQDQKWIRPVGCDIPAQSVVLPKGHSIDPVAIGLLKQSGVQSIKVKRKIKVGVLSTGNELIVDAAASTTESKLSKGKIPDVNRPILLSLLTTYRNCCEPIDLGMVRDDNVDAMASTLQEALHRCDVIITTGGVSMGETDIVEHVLVEKCSGTVQFGRMHMKPGKPTTFVTVPVHGDNQTLTKLVFAMPGNPVSATVCTQLLVKPCLDLYFHGLDMTTMSESDANTATHLEKVIDMTFVHPEIQGKLAHDIKLDKKRPEYHRVTVETAVDGGYEVSTTGNQRSSRLMSLRDAEALLVLPHAHGVTNKALKGETYPVLLLSNSFGGVKPVRIKDSIHLQRPLKAMKISVVEVMPSKLHLISKLHDHCALIQSALSGSKSGSADVISKRVYDGPVEDLHSFIVSETSEDTDFIVVVCASFEGSFQYHLDVSNLLLQKLSKIANSLALQARQGAASQDATAALFEVVAGYVPEKQGAMLICLPDTGVGGALSNVRGLMKHGLNLARGKPHNHHHSHSHHKHA